MQDVTFTNNRVLNVNGRISMLGFDDGHPSQQLQRVLVRNNLWEGPQGTFVLMVGPIDGVTLDHNTALGVNTFSILAANAASPHFVLTNNLLGYGLFGIAGDAVGNGNRTLAAYYPGAVVERNVLVGLGKGRNQLGDLPPLNFIELALANLGLIDLATGNLRLSELSRYHGAGTDGSDIGVDFDALMQDLLLAMIGRPEVMAGDFTLDSPLADISPTPEPTGACSCSGAHSQLWVLRLPGGDRRRASGRQRTESHHE